jgi:hypothetical protein
MSFFYCGPSWQLTGPTDIPAQFFWSLLTLNKYLMTFCHPAEDFPDLGHDLSLGTTAIAVLSFRGWKTHRHPNVSFMTLVSC